MPRPTTNTITFTIDGREVQAPEDMMLVDAAMLGDVEIPVFCYEPKLGNPVGACRMCLVEIEGIGKLQTGCSTPVKDGMVVHTRSQRAEVAQRGVVEFLLINHPLDCPVCDKGGECPLQDITFGWGPGISRFIEPKRHFVKPLELSPLIAIDRERCILCYRCVRFSQEIAEDYQLVLLERGAHSYVSTFDGHPYVAPFSGNIVELCPVGALTSRAYRFRARPWDVEEGGSVCTLCPAQCNVTLTVREERVLRVQARDNAEVDDGWLCDKGRFAYQSIHVDERITEPLIKDGATLRPVSWEHALDHAASALIRARDTAASAGGPSRIAALAGGQVTNEEGHLLKRLIREALDSDRLDTTAGIDPTALHRLARPDLQATVSEIDVADTILVVATEPIDDIPIVDLRIRKAVRRHGAKLVVATPRPSSLDSSAAISVRYAPGTDSSFLAALAGALYGGDIATACAAARVAPEQIHDLAQLLRAGETATSTLQDVVIVYGHRALDRAPAAAAAALLKIAGGLNLSDRDCAGLLGVPTLTNGRGLIEAGVAPGYDSGYRPRSPAQGGSIDRIGKDLAAGALTVLYLLDCDPMICDLPQNLWRGAMEQASTVIAHAAFLTEGISEHADVVFPAESYAEKEGTVVHPDGRIQRLRPAIGHQGNTRAGWWILAELASRCGLDTGVGNASAVSHQLFESTPIYTGLTLEEIGGRGVAWQRRPQWDRSTFPPDPTPTIEPSPRGRPPDVEPSAPSPVVPSPPSPDVEPSAPAPDGALRLGTFRSIWAATEVRVSPALHFLHPSQQVEISPADAAAAKLSDGDEVLVSDASDQGRDHVTAATVRATIALRESCPVGSVFLQNGIGPDSASALAGPLVVVRPAPPTPPPSESHQQPDPTTGPQPEPAARP